MWTVRKPRRPGTCARPRWSRARTGSTPAYFGCTPREAALLDPQQRLFLECAAEALQSAGHDPEQEPGAIGVFASVSVNEYGLRNVYPHRGLDDVVGYLQKLLANDKDFIASRTAYKLGLRGPAVTVQTACSSSLVAIHLACQSLLAGRAIWCW